jgi:hypothetical protein
MRVPGYNSPQRMTLSNRLLTCIFALLSFTSAHAVNSWDASSSDFAKQIAALTGPGTITLVVTNRSSLSSDDVTAIRHALERELRAGGLAVRAKDADADVRVTLSQNMQGLLWVAEVQEGSATKVAMLPIAGSTGEAATSSPPAITLHANLIVAQANQVLDATIVGTGTDQHLIVLEPGQLRSYSQVAGQWQTGKSYDIAHTQPFPRDMRGRIVTTPDHLIDAYLPGVVCSATKVGDSWDLNVACNDSDDPWPLGSQKAFYNSTRNFFTGVLAPGFGPKLPLFYSAAELPRNGTTAFLFGDIGGTVHLLEGNSNKTLLGARDWGSDFVAVHSGCGQGTQVLTSTAGWPASDSVRAYEITGREATPMSAPLTFDGTITAVWPSADGAAATVVVQKQESRYEAYLVSVACSR